MQVIMWGPKVSLGHKSWSHGSPDDRIACDAPILGALTMVLPTHVSRDETNVLWALDQLPYNVKLVGAQ